MKKETKTGLLCTFICVCIISAIITWFWFFALLGALFIGLFFIYVWYSKYCKNHHKENKMNKLGKMIIKTFL